jgi:hypothetical protein
LKLTVSDLPQGKEKSRAHLPFILALAFSAPLFLSACGAPPGSPGKIPTMMDPPPRMVLSPELSQAPPTSVSAAGLPIAPDLQGVKLPVENKSPLLKTPLVGAEAAGGVPNNSGLDIVDVDGYSLRLASSIITVGSNPFLNRLNRPKPKPLQTAATNPLSSQGSDPIVVPPPAPVDPLTSLSLVGIVYNRTAPMALISIAGEENSRMVHIGEKLGGDGMPQQQLRVVSIQRDRVDFQMSGLHGKKRTLNLPGLMSKTATPMATGASVNAYKNTLPASESNNGGVSGMAATQTPDLSNLNKLMDSVRKSGPTGSLQ